jgi:hypothetical protein
MDELSCPYIYCNDVTDSALTCTSPHGNVLATAFVEMEKLPSVLRYMFHSHVLPAHGNQTATFSRKTAVFWVVAPCNLVEVYQAASTFYQTTRRYNPEDSHLRTHRRENLKSYLATFSGHSLGGNRVLSSARYMFYFKARLSYSEETTERYNTQQAAYLFFSIFPTWRLIELQIPSTAK